MDESKRSVSTALRACKQFVLRGSRIKVSRLKRAAIANVPEIEELAKQYASRPIIVCGDFNDTPESRVCRRLSETFDDTWSLVGQGDGFTIPPANPRKRIDYIWISKDKSLVPLKAWVPQSDASDHLPIVAEFELR